MKLAKKYRDRIRTEYWDDGYYWIDLKPGFKNGDDPIGVCHGITENTIAECYAKVRDSMACNCSDCVYSQDYMLSSIKRDSLKNRHARYSANSIA